MPFEKHFVENPDPNKPNQMKIDETIDGKLQMWKEVFLTDILRWAHDCRINLKGPPQLLKSTQAATDRYRSENDYYMEFSGEKIAKSALSKDTLTWTDVWDSFRSWMGQSYGRDNLPKRIEARKKFEGSKCFNQKLHKGV